MSRTEIKTLVIRIALLAAAFWAGYYWNHRDQGRLWREVQPGIFVHLEEKEEGLVMRGMRNSLQRHRASAGVARRVDGTFELTLRLGGWTNALEFDDTSEEEARLEFPR